MRRWACIGRLLAGEIRTVWVAPSERIQAAERLPPGSRVTFELNAGDCGLPENTVRAALKSAVGCWICAGVPLVLEIGQTGGSAHVAVKWRRFGTSTIPRAINVVPSSSSGAGSITFNCNVDWDRKVSFDYVALHEVGNILGLVDECNDPYGIMCDDGFVSTDRKQITCQEIENLKMFWGPEWSPGVCGTRPTCIAKSAWAVLSVVRALRALGLSKTRWLKRLRRVW